MGKFNKKAEVASNIMTSNLAGGDAFVASEKWKLVSLLLTSFVKDQFYRDEAGQITEVKNLLKNINDKKFIAKAAIYARRVFGMRSITHVLAAELAQYISGQTWNKDFYKEVIFRPDDMSEIMSYFWANLSKDKKLPNSMKKGFAQAFDKFDQYQLAKYKGDGKEVSLIDVVNLVHPVPTSRNRTALKGLIDGVLKNTKTWEAKLSSVGQQTTDDVEKSQMKGDVWKEMLTTKSIGYLGLLRNLKNIIEQAPELVDLACERLTDASWIKAPKNLVFPFQYLIAYKQFEGITGSAANKVLLALSKALEISCDNVPKFGGETLVVVDNSGSMDSPVNGSVHIKKSEIGAIFAMVLAKSCGADLMEFGTTARYIPFNPADSAMTFGKNFVRLNQVGHGTDFPSIFKKANKKYDRIVIFSDMQGWINGTPKGAFDNYKKTFGANPFIYSFDLAGHGTLQFPENKTFLLAGFSEKVLSIMETLEKDRNAIIKEIDKIVL